MSWYEDDKLWEMFYHCMFDEDSFALAQQQVPMLLSLTRHPVKTVMDLGCGPGRHCLALAKMGCQVSGIDTSEFLLNKARQKAQDSSLNIDFIQANMLDHQPNQSQDLIINMFNSFGYFDQPEENQTVLDNAYAHLNTPGTLIIDTVGKETLARTIEPVHLSEYDNGDLRIERPLLIDDMRIFSNEWILIRDDMAFRRSYQHFVYTPVELTQMCQQAGFKSVDVYGSLQMDDYDLDADRLVVVAHKS